MINIFSSEIIVFLESMERERFQVDRADLQRYCMLRKHSHDNNEVSTVTAEVDMNNNIKPPQVVIPVAIRGEILRLIIDWIQHEKELVNNNKVECLLETNTEMNFHWRRHFIDRLELHLLTEVLWAASLLGVPSLSKALTEKISATCMGTPTPEDVRLMFNLAGGD